VLIGHLLVLLAQVLLVRREFKIAINVRKQLLQSVGQVLLVSVAPHQLNRHFVALDCCILVLVRILFVTVNASQFLHHRPILRVN